ncbi:MAG TPA: LPXTG cell wall anchor domain-containing protein [Streptosporangiaceae bacterium]
MRTRIKNGARMTILVTAFAAAGAGVAYSHVTGGPARHADVVSTRLISCDDCDSGLSTSADVGSAIGGPLGQMAYIGKESGQASIGTETETGNDKVSDGPAVLGRDLPEETTSSTDIPGSDCDNECASTGGGTPGGSGTPGGGGGGTPGGNGGGTPGGGSGTPGGNGSGTPGMPSGHHGHHCHTMGHHGHHDMTGHHGMSGHHGSTGRHMTGGHTASVTAKSAPAAPAATAAAQAGSNAQAGTTLPTTGAPMAGLAGLALAALAAGVVLLAVKRRSDEDESPNEE